MVEDVVARVERHAPRSLLILGASDTGKTTLAETLLRAWCPHDTLAVVDCDVGQSTLGPPTTISWGLRRWPCNGWAEIARQAFVFTGAVSPDGNVETCVAAAERMCAQARAAAARLLIDTTGLVQGDTGLALKLKKIERLRPDLILALQRADELENLLCLLGQVPVERLPARPNCRSRTLPQRAAVRDAQLNRYFGQATPQTVDGTPERWIGLGPAWPRGDVAWSPEALMNRVVSFRTADGTDAALGVVRAVDVERRRCQVVTPLADLAAARTVCVGSACWPEVPCGA